MFLLGSSLQYNFLALHSENLKRTQPWVFTDQTHPDSRQKARKITQGVEFISKRCGCLDFGLFLPPFSYESAQIPWHLVALENTSYTLKYDLRFMPICHLKCETVWIVSNAKLFQSFITLKWKKIVARQYKYLCNFFSLKSIYKYAPFAYNINYIGKR